MLLAAFAGVAPAATFTWDGGHPGQERWTDAQNWNPNGAPPNDGTADLVFGGTVRLAPNSNGAWSVNSITFNSLAGAFTLVGGTLTLQGASVTHAIANDDTDTQTINNALVTASNQSWSATAGALALAGPIANAHALTLAGAFDTRIAGVVSGSGSLAKTGSGTLTLSGANTYSGGTTVSAGTIRGTTTSLQGTITTASGASLVFDQSSSGSYSGVISGAGSVTKSGSGSVTLSGANTHTGSTTVSAGTLVLSGGSALADTSAVVLADVSGATLSLSASETIGSLSGGGATGGHVSLSSHTLTVGGANTSTTYSGVISGSGSLTKTGSGTLSLSGANTYSGGTTVSAGSLRGTTTSLQGNISAGSGASLEFDQSSSGSYSGVISGAGSVTKSGSGSVTLSGSNTHTGPTTVSAGTLVLSGGSALADTSAVVLADVSGATLSLSASETIGSLSGGGATGGHVSLSSHTLTVGGADTSTTYSGVISGSGSLAKAGSGILTLSGANTYSGGTTVSAGSLRGTTTSLQGDISTASGASLIFDQSSSGAYSGVISGAGSVTKSGSGSVTLSGANTYTGALLVSAGSVVLGANDALSAAGDLALSAGATLSLNGSYSTRVSDFSYTDAVLDFGAPGSANAFLFNAAGAGSGVLTVNNWESGSDILAFASGNTPAASFIENIYFTGVGSGVLGASGVSVSGYTGAWDTIVASAASFSVWDGGGANDTFATAANWAGDSAPASSATTKISLDGATRTAPNLNADFTLNSLKFETDAASFALTANANREFTFDGVVPSLIQSSASDQAVHVPLVLTKNTFAELAGAGDLTLSGEVSGAGGFTVLGAGDGRLVLSGANTYAGSTTISAGTVVLQNSAALGSVAAGTTVSSGATLRLENNISVGAESLALSGTLHQASGANTYSGPVSGSGTLLVSGGQLTLSGSSANTLSGSALIDAGTLVLAKSSGVTALAGDIVVGDGSSSATLRLAASHQIADTSRVTLSSGPSTFDLDGRSETIGSLASANASATVILGSGSLSTGADHSSTSFAGVISGSGSLAKTGSGTFTLSGSNTYSGATTVSAGVVVLQNSAALGSVAAGTTVAAGVTLRLENNISVGTESLALSGTLHQASGANTYSGPVSGSGALLVSGGQLTLSGSSANTLSGSALIDAGTLVLAKSSGVASLAGDVVIGDGASSATLRLAASHQIADTSRVTLSSGASSFDLDGHDESIGSLSSANAASTVVLGSASLSTGADHSSTSFAGVISGSGSLAKTGSGTFTLSGSNTYSGATTVSAGTLALASSDCLSDSSALHLAGGSLSLGGAASERVGVLSYAGGVIDFGPTGSANHLLFSDDGASSGALTIRNWTSSADVLGSATASLDQTFLDNIFFDGLGVGIGAEIGSLVSVSGYGDFYQLRPIQTFVWIGGNDSGPSPRDAWSRGANWEGGIAPGVGADKAVVMAGSVDLAHDVNGAYIVRSLLFNSSAGAFDLSSSTGDTLTVRGGGIYNDSASAQTLALSVAVGANQTWNAAAGDLAFSGTNVLLGANTLSLDGAHDISVSAVVTGTAAAALVKNGSGSATLSAANTFSGSVAVHAGTLVAAHASALGASSGGVVVHSGATLALSGGVTVSAEALTLSGSGADDAGALRNTSGANAWTGSVALAADAAIVSASGSLALSGPLDAGLHTLTVAGAGDITISSTIANATGLVKTGAGTLTFSADQTFAGEITLSGGALALADAAVVAETLRVTAGSVLDFGGASTLTVENLVLQLADGEYLTVTSWTEFTDYFVAAAFDGAVYDLRNIAPMNRVVFADFDASDTRWHASDNQVNPVPEPAAYGALSLGGLLALRLLRRRRRPA